MVLAVNMMDAARRRGIAIDLGVLERELGVPVVETVAVKHGGARRPGGASRCRRGRRRRPTLVPAPRNCTAAYAICWQRPW